MSVLQSLEILRDIRARVERRKVKAQQRRQRKRYLSPGTISEGTLRPEDLIPEVLWHLQQIKLSRADRMIVREIATEFNRMSDAYDPEVLSQLWQELSDVAGNNVPDYCSFGGHEGDPACVGVWVDIESAQLAVQEGDLWSDATREPYQEGSRSDVTEHGYAKFHGDQPIMSTFRAEVPNGGRYLVISDHGNVSLYQSRGAKRTAREIWGIV